MVSTWRSRPSDTPRKKPSVKERLNALGGDRQTLRQPWHRAPYSADDRRHSQKLYRHRQWHAVFSRVFRRPALRAKNPWYPTAGN